MSTNRTHITENKKVFADYKALIPKIKITEVKQVQIIAFWVTLVVFTVLISFIITGFLK